MPATEMREFGNEIFVNLEGRRGGVLRKDIKMSESQ